MNTYNLILTNDIKCPRFTYIKNGMCKPYAIKEPEINPIECLYNADIYYKNQCYIRCKNNYIVDLDKKQCILKK